MRKHVTISRLEEEDNRGYYIFACYERLLATCDGVKATGRYPLQKYWDLVCKKLSVPRYKNIHLMCKKYHCHMDDLDHIIFSDEDPSISKEIDEDTDENDPYLKKENAHLLPELLIKFNRSKRAMEERNYYLEQVRKSEEQYKDCLRVMNYPQLEFTAEEIKGE